MFTLQPAEQRRIQDIGGGGGHGCVCGKEWGVAAPGRVQEGGTPPAQLGGMGERCKLPLRGLGRSPRSQRPPPPKYAKTAPKTKSSAYMHVQSADKPLGQCSKNLVNIYGNTELTVCSFRKCTGFSPIGVWGGAPEANARTPPPPPPPMIISARIAHTLYTYESIVVGIGRAS